MRISTAYQFSTYARDVTSAQVDYFTAQRQVATGRRFESVSEDPFGAARVLNMSALREATNQYRANLGIAKGNLGFAETALGEASLVMRRANELAVRGANGATDQTGREAMVREVENLQNRLIALGNSQGPNGSYLFAGQRIDQPPLQRTSVGLVYQGDNLDVSVETGPGTTMATSVVGDPLFTDAYNALESLKNNLAGGNLGGLSGVDIPALNASRTALDQARGTLGSRLQSIEQMTADLMRREDDLKLNISEVQEVDMAEAITRMRSAEAAYQAALQVAAQGYRLSLADYL